MPCRRVATAAAAGARFCRRCSKFKRAITRLTFAECRLCGRDCCPPCDRKAQNMSTLRVVMSSGKAFDQRCSVGRYGELPKTYGAGRRCAAGPCDTVLSRYNPGDVCCLHHHAWQEPPALPRVQSNAAPTVGTCQLESCVRTFVTTSRLRKYCSDRCRMEAFLARPLRVAQASTQASDGDRC